MMSTRANVYFLVRKRRTRIQAANGTVHRKSSIIDHPRPRRDLTTRKPQPTVRPGNSFIHGRLA